jgi:N6-L-threonylcarbamoyladenine synthase
MTLPPTAGPRSGLILGIESSCDETAAAVLRFTPEARSEVLSNIVASQVALHAAYGGVVPELASREHLRNIVPVVRQAIAQAGIALADLDAIAVTEGPGLAGALLVGILYAKALAFGLDKPLIAINHLEGHIHAVLLESHKSLGAPTQTASPSELGSTSANHKTLGAPFIAPLSHAMSGNVEAQPLLALVVSGGHTHLYLATEHHQTGSWTYKNVGRTVDDAAGEAFDKVAKLLGLGYPGGSWIDALATHGNPSAVPFQFHQIKSHSQKSLSSFDEVGGPASVFDPALRFDFSFSGIKTAVLRYTQTHALEPSIEARRTALAAAPDLKPSEAAHLCDRQTLGLIASFQSAVVGNLIRQTFAAAEAFGARGLLISGGVAANRELRRRFTAEAAHRGLPIAFPSIALSTDNAAMIAAAAWPRLLAHDLAPESMSAAPQLKLG